MALASLGGVRAETMDQLYQKAKGEGSLLFYSGGPVEPYERWAKEFMARSTKAEGDSIEDNRFISKAWSVSA